MKYKIPALLLVLCCVMSLFTSCSGGSGTDETTADEGVQITTAAQAKIITPTDEDFKALEDMLSYLYMGQRDINYDCGADYALFYAIHAVYNGCWGGLLKYYGYSDFDYFNSYNQNTGERNTDEPDPLGKFGTNEYFRVEAETVDNLITTVFNIEPDHDKTFADYKEYTDKFHYFEKDYSFYYYNGFYYFLCADGGGAANGFTVESKTALSDGKYEIKLKNHDFDEEEDYEEITLVASLKERAGDRMWSIYSLTNPNEY